MSFAWVEEETPLLRFAAPEPFSVVFTSRLGGVSSGRYNSLNLGMASGDDVTQVASNRARAVTAAGGDPARTAGVWQHHSADVIEVGEPPRGAYLDSTVDWPRGDALVTQTAGVTLVAQGADCLTVAICSPAGRLATVHAGWGGLLRGVLENAVAAAGDDAICAVGPGAGPCCYEVRDDVGVPLQQRFGDDIVRAGRADLWACAERALAAAGAAEVHVARECTICQPGRFFSHRRDGAPGGRQGLIARIAS